MLYPQINKKRTVIDLSGLWDFALEKSPIDVKKPLKDTIQMAVPGSFNDQVADVKIRDFIGNVWYEKDIEFPEIVSSERCVLRFGSVTNEASVFLNGNLITRHKGGYLPFEIDVTEHIIPGSNNIKICVSNIIDNTTLPNGVLREDAENGKKIIPNFDFYNFAGIHRPILLYTTNKTYIEDIVIKYEYNHETEKTKVNPEIVAVGDYAKVQFEICDENNKVVSKGILGEKLTIENTRLWEPLNAYLYKLKVSLLDDNNEVIDVYSEEFGVRTLEIENNNFFINGKKFYFKGYGKHEDFPVIGRGLNNAVNNLDFNLMKWSNANSLRTAHYPYSEEFLRQADREGFVVIAEASGVGLFNKFNFDVTRNKDDYENTWEYVESFEHHKNVIDEMIRRDKNHPCIVAWAVGNEPASHQKGAREYFKPLIELTKELDWEKRAVIIPNIVNATADSDLVADLVDIIALNRYYGWYIDHGDMETASVKFREEIEKWHNKYPDKPIFISEFGADTIQGFNSVYATPFTEEFQVEYLAKNFEVMDEFDYVIGEHVWNFSDFETYPNVRRVDGNKKGIFTRDRKPKLAAHYLKDRWSNPNLKI